MEAVISGRIVAKDSKVKIARKRLSVLQLADNLGSVSEACRRVAWTGLAFTLRRSDLRSKVW